MHRYVIGAAFAIASSPAFADTILTCTYEEGRAYYPELKDAENRNTGWKTEDMKGTQIRLDKTESGYDVLFGDGKSGLNSSTTAGATVADLSHEENTASFLVLYPNRSIETYYFYDTPREAPALLVSKVKFNAAVGMSSIHRYTCKR